VRKRSNEVARDGRRRGLEITNVRGVFFALCLAGAFSLSLGCSATVTAGVPRVAGHDVVAAQAVPVGIERYPRVVYRGEWAYLVDGLWYYPTASGWVIFQDEPPELAQYRMRYERTPGVQRAPDVQYGYPGAHPTPPREIDRQYRR
jgi:hypothetical protein